MLSNVTKALKRLLSGTKVKIAPGNFSRNISTTSTSSSRVPPGSTVKFGFHPGAFTQIAHLKKAKRIRLTLSLRLLFHPHPPVASTTLFDPPKITLSNPAWAGKLSETAVSYRSTVASSGGGHEIEMSIEVCISDWATVLRGNLDIDLPFSGSVTPNATDGIVIVEELDW